MKGKTKFVCQQCGHEEVKWLGRCPDCGEWNTMVEEIIDKKRKNIYKNIDVNRPRIISNIKSEESIRYDTGIKELNRVLGGGLVKGSLVLITGEPGIGKSTLLLQISKNLSEKYGNVLYISGEESEQQIKLRAHRLDCLSDSLFVVSETDVQLIEEYIDQINPVFIVVDSIQTLYMSELSSAPGSVSQVRECTNSLMRLGKSKDIPMFIVAHVTKKGELAGPQMLAHLVDTVVMFQHIADQGLRILRASKNRFGSTNEIGLFEMRDKGLEEVIDPSEFFLESINSESEGAMVISSIEGTRPIIVEIQSLVTYTNMNFPRRTSIGVDLNRLNLILAVLEKKVGVQVSNMDVYVNVVGGIKLEGTSYDLGVALSIYSSFREAPIKINEIIAIGEISLTGEIRPVAQIDIMVKEAVKLGFKKCIISSKSSRKLTAVDGIEIVGVDNLHQAIDYLFK